MSTRAATTRAHPTCPTVTHEPEPGRSTEHGSVRPPGSVCSGGVIVLSGRALSPSVRLTRRVIRAVTSPLRSILSPPQLLLEPNGPRETSVRQLTASGRARGGRGHKAANLKVTCWDGRRSPESVVRFRIYRSWWRALKHHGYTWVSS